jgi:two-component system sensor histidine kinase PilS (NtrC family)
MDHISLMLVTLVLAVLLLILFFVARAMGNSRKRRDVADKGATEVGFVVDTFHDLVSKLKEKERELEILRRKAEDRASSVEIYNEDILQSVPSGVVSFDQELRITKMNHSAEKMLEMSETESVGKKYSEIFNEPVAGIIGKEPLVGRAEIGYVTKSGKRIWLGLNISLLKDSSNKTIGKIFIFTDLTELKAFQSQMELRERLSTLGEMSAGIAHELRNPLGVISGYTKLLSKKVDGKLYPTVEAILKEVAVMDRIISDFLSFARQTDLMPSEVDLKGLLKGCIAAVADCAGGVRIIERFETLPMVRVDEVMLRQSVTNILQNAVESMPEGGDLTVTCSVGDCLDISFEDTGHGIPLNMRDKVFLPFFTTKERGTGLGLSIVHKIVVSHGGTVQLESGEKGTIITIKLPKDLIVSR